MASMTHARSSWTPIAAVARIGVALLGSLTICACTTVGVHTAEVAKIDYGEPVTVRVCVLKTDDTPHLRVDSLVKAINREFAQYNIAVDVPWVRPWKRPGFSVDPILADLLKQPLEPPCDRLVGVVDRHIGDFLWGLALPEVLGAVDDLTATRGYVVATWGSLNQIFMTPEQAAVHEFYHLVGCPHGMTLSKCYPRIAALKQAAVAGEDFFPGVAKHETFLTTRAEAQAAIDAYFAEAEGEADAKPDQDSRRRRR
jgi:hypothetical protein